MHVFVFERLEGALFKTLKLYYVPDNFLPVSFLLFSVLRLIHSLLPYLWIGCLFHFFFKRLNNSS